MNMNTPLQSRLTDRYQTTVPEAVRRALNLNKRDKLEYRILPDGSVVMLRAVIQEDDPALGAFLTFLVQDIQQAPSSIHALDSDWVNKIVTLTQGVEINLDEPLSEEWE